MGQNLKLIALAIMLPFVSVAQWAMDFDESFYKKPNDAPVSLPDPVAWWTMDDNAASTVVINSVGSTNGVFSVNTSTRSVAGKLNTALSFNGVNMGINVGGHIALSTEFTITTWVYQTASQYGRIYDNWSPKEAVRIWMYGNILYFQIGNGTSTDAFQGAQTIANSTWTFIAATFKNGQMDLYVNASRDRTGKNSAVTTIYQNTANRWIGLGSDASMPFGGYIDETRVYNTAFTQAQITALYSSY